MVLYEFEKLKVLHRLAICAGIFLLPACDRSQEVVDAPPESTMEEFTVEQRAEQGWTEHMNSAWEETRKAVESLAPLKDKVTEGAQSEYSKLFGMEYRVVEIDESESAEEMEQKLSMLGKERWDCFHILQADDKLRLICKRRPESWLRHMGRLAPFLPVP